MGRGMLILTAGFVIVIGILQMGINNRQQIIPQRSTDYVNQTEARNIANSLMDYAVMEVREFQHWQQENGDEGGFFPGNFLGGQGGVAVYDQDDFNGNDPDIPADHNISDWDEFTLLLVSTGEHNGYRAKTYVKLSKDSFAKYTYFTDEEPSNIYFYDDDVLEGPVHTNGVMKIAGSPTFKGDVSSPNQWQPHSNGGDPDFQADTNFSSQYIDLPLGENLDELRATASGGSGLRFNNHIRAHFRTQVQGTDTLGFVDIAEWNGSYWDNEQTYNMDNTKVISATGQVHTKGEVKGQVTIHSEELVEIDGDLTYHKDPRDYPDNPNYSTDLVGIVSEKNVRIDELAHLDKGSKDLNVHASIMAIDKSFYVEDYWDTVRGNLNLLGGIQQKRRGAVGTFNGNGIASGFSKEYTYDERLQRTFPPAYPRENVFSRDYWREKPVTKIQS